MLISCAVATGNVKCGNMGCEGLKKFTFLSPVVTFTHALERLGRIISSAAGTQADIQWAAHLLEPGHPRPIVLADEKSCEDARSTFYMRLVDHVKFWKVKRQVLLVHEVMQKKTVS